MATYADFIVLGHPRAQSRPRTFRNGGVATDSPACVDWKAAVIAGLIDDEAAHQPQPGAPLELEIQFMIPIADPNKHGWHHVGTPDVDNLWKAIADALQEPKGRDLQKALKSIKGGLRYSGFIPDDSAISDAIVRKRYSGKPGGCRIILRDAPYLEEA